MKWSLCALAFTIGPLWGEANIYPLPVAEGSAEIEWLSGSTFRFARRFGNAGAVTSPFHEQQVSVIRADLGEMLRFQTEHLIVDIAKSDLKLRVQQRKSGEIIFEDAAPVRKTAEGVVAERASQKDEDYWGLGPRTAPAYGARGLVFETLYPFLVSTRGFALHHAGGGKWKFDLKDRMQATALGANQLEYFFYYGPAPKEMFEEHLKVVGPIVYHEDDVKPLEAGEVPRYATKLDFTGCELIPAMAHAAMSAMVATAAKEWDFSPLLYSAKPGPLRAALYPYLVTYMQEAHDRGYPVIRPLPFQFPSDLEGAKRTDEFQVGDELLVAPLCGGATKRSVYLPRGIWTDMRTGVAYAGRKTIDIETPAGALPMFAKNGALFPLAEDGLMCVHYFPKLGGEFFIWEPDLEIISQLHTSPALDLYRIEIESMKTRTYEWVLHEMTRPDDVYEVDAAKFREVKSKAQLAAGCWYFDAGAKTVSVRIDAVAGKDHIVNLTWLVK
jgi:hypothetical protein